MTKFQKIQKISSIVPFYSTFFVAFVTMFELKRHKASAKMWFFFVATFFLSWIAVYILNAFIMTGQHIILNVIASGLVLAVANVLFVDFQVMCSTVHPEKAPMAKSMIVVICCVLAGVITIGGVVLLLLLHSPSVDIEDVNGSQNTNLATIDMNEILTTIDHFSAFSSYTSYDGTNTNVVGDLKEYDHTEVVFHCKKISGIKTLHATKTTCDQLTLVIESELKTGNMEIVIMVDDEYYDHVPINQASTVLLTDITNKTVVVKMAAESAEMNISVQRTAEDSF